MEKEDKQATISRRAVLRCSLAAGLALAAGGAVREALATDSVKAAVDRPEAAKAHFLKSMNCSQAIFEIYAPAYGIKAEQARKLATGFAAGMGMGHECGALTAAYMVLGLAHGPKGGDVFPKIEALNKEFKARHQALGCSELLGFDMGTKEGRKDAKNKGCFTSRCTEYIKTVGDILEKMLV